MAKTQLGTQLGHHVVSKVRPMMGYDGLLYAKASYNVVKMNNVAVLPSSVNVGIASTHLVK